MTTIVTVSDIGGYKSKVKLTADKDIAEYLRSVANDGRDTPIEADDNAVLSLIATSNLPTGKKQTISQWQEWQDAFIATLHTADDATVTDDATVDDDAVVTDDDEATVEEIEATETEGVDVRAEPAAAAKTDAREIATILSGSEIFLRELREDMDAGEKIKRAPLVLMQIIRSLFQETVSGKPAWPAMDLWPVPNTTWKNKDNNPDKMKVSVRDVSTGEWKDKTVGHYDLIFSALPEGKRLDDEIAAINKRKSDAVANIANKWRSVGDDVCKSEKKTREARRTSGRTLLRRAVALHMQLMAVKRDLPEITARFLQVTDPKTKKAVPINSTYPIVIKEVKAQPAEGDAEPVQRFTTVSVTQFLGFKVKDALDPVKVKEKGGVYDAFIGSSGKGSSDDEPEAEGKQMDVKQAVDVLGLFAGWADNTANVQLLRKHMRSDLATVQSVCRAHLEIAPLYAQFRVIFDHAEAGDEAKARAMLANLGRIVQAKRKAS